MAEERPLVKSTTSKRQIRFAERKAKEAARQELEDLRAVLGSEVGRRVIYRFLQSTLVFKSIALPLELIAYNAGRQDVGHYLMTLIEQADDTAIFTMMQEATVAKRKDARERDAVHVDTKDESDGSED